MFLGFYQLGKKGFVIGKTKMSAGSNAAENTAISKKKESLAYF